MYRYFAVAGLLSVAVWAGLGPLAVRAEDRPGMDPKAIEVLRAVSDHLAGLESFRVELNSVMGVTARGMAQTMETARTLEVARPDRLALRVEPSAGMADIVTDGDALFMYNMEDKRYRQAAAPTDLDSIIGIGAQGPEELPLVLAQHLWSSDPFSMLLENVQKLSYAGLETRGGTEMHRLRFEEPDFNWEMWVEAGDTPWVRRLEVEIPSMLERLREMDEEGELTLTLDLDAWQANPGFAADHFAFVPASDMQEVRAQEPAAERLLREPAPAFSLELLGGGELDLAEHLGTDVVVLDFWATWCGPCRDGLPILDRVTRKYADQGVRFYAVNLQEEEPAIERFLEAMNLDIPVPMDKSGEVSQMYGVTAIPQTVIVGTDGTVQAVHLGVAPDLEDRLTRELETLISGELLAGGGA